MKELKVETSTTKSVRFEKPYFYWQVEGDTKDGPFCQKCFEYEGKFSRLTDCHDGNDGCWHCSVCEETYRSEDHTSNAS